MKGSWKRSDPGPAERASVDEPGRDVGGGRVRIPPPE